MIEQPTPYPVFYSNLEKLVKLNMVDVQSARNAWVSAKREERENDGIRATDSQ
jgi:hypothetical protein